ncbi:MAG: prepilin-type N-terminal cleavage/methylation domain-containing protein [Patescibacteria group bacterium]|nr:prepilin-type N-terminal cleavage/methylation domain-containing protein [Patescibacteria group bacterium]
MEFGGWRRTRASAADAHRSPLQAPHFKLAASQRGFTLIETMVAIAILTIALVGPFIVAESSYQAAAAARDQLTASYLAQEGIEYVRSVRDDNYLVLYPARATSGQWLNGLSACLAPKVCTVDATGNAAPSTCTDGTCAAEPLNLSSTGLYNQASPSSSNLATKFVRKVEVTVNPSYPDEAEVTVTVSWSSAHRQFTATATDHLFNWL